MAKITISGQNELISEDVQKWLKNVLIFSTPALIIFLTSLSNGSSLQDSAKVLYVVVLNALIDLLRKFQGTTEYIK